MTAILYPVAANAELASASPLGHAAREREALSVAGEAVVFTTDPTGPAFATREAGVAAYGALLDDPWRRLTEQILPGQKLAHAEPVMAEGRRWPAPAGGPPRTAWRLMVSYWRIATAARPIETPQARRARRARQALDAETVHAMAQAPLRPVEPQQPLDIGLFETRLPEAPHIVVPDE
ncbi:MAG TPA: hypothetical protein VFE10_04440 [Phenylobacterium sp.]|nr:hypothetical protein [Phenylobacterium sp.]